MVRDNTMFPERLADWQNWEHRFDGKLKDKNKFKEAIGLMLGELNDEYTYFRNEEETQSSQNHDDDSSVIKTLSLPNKIAYVGISTFSSCHTADELEEALKALSDSQAYIVDLRDNHGGYVEQALESFQLMSEKGRFVSMSGREDGKAYNETITLKESCLERTVNGNKILETRRKNICADKPMIVLINEDTRSAAEMLAGALKDSRGAKLVGSRTFGKGIVQSSWFLEPGCSIKIAMAKYYLPSGRDINGCGIAPDFVAEFKNEEKTRELSSKNLNAQLSGLKKLLPPEFSLQASTE